MSILLMQLTLDLETPKPIAINPQHVVSITPLSSKTHIDLSNLDSDDSAIRVTETYSDVVAKWNSCMNA